VTPIDSSGACRENHCITCSDEGIPMRVLALDIGTGLAVCVDPDGARAEVDIALVEPLVPGDSVLAHAGVALARLEEGALA
jgi:hydrogenase maturation factor